MPIYRHISDILLYDCEHYPQLITVTSRQCPLFYLSNQVKKRKQENPYNINKVPVKSGVFELHECLPVDYLLPCKKKHDPYNSNSDDNMKCVYAGHNEIQPEEKNLPAALQHKQR